MSKTIYFDNKNSINSLVDKNQPLKKQSIIYDSHIKRSSPISNKLKEKDYKRISGSFYRINTVRYKPYFVNNIAFSVEYNYCLSQLDQAILNLNYRNINLINQDFDITLKRLFELQEEDPDIDEDDEDEIYYPSYYAFSGSFKLLRDLYSILGSSFPRGYASLEARGGVNLIWKNHKLDKQVLYKFSVDQSLPNTVYFRQGDESRLIKEPQTIFVAKLLQWLITENSFTEMCQLLNV